MWLACYLAGFVASVLLTRDELKSLVNTTDTKDTNLVAWLKAINALGTLGSHVLGKAQSCQKCLRVFTLTLFLNDFRVNCSEDEII